MTEPSSHGALPVVPRWIAPVFVWGAWASTVIAALIFVGTYGGNLPFWDDWAVVPVITGNQPITAAWLWELHNEHRMPLPKLLILALYECTGNDFRSGMVFNVLALGVLASCLILTARHLRGRSRCSDAFFPVILLNLGLYEIFLINFTVNLTLSTILAGILLAIITRSRTGLTNGATALAGISLVSLPLCGANGLALVPALAVWFGYSGLLHWHSTGRRGKLRGLLTLSLSFISIFEFITYFIYYRRPYYCYDPALAGLRGQLRTSLQFLSMGFGPAVSSFWPYSGLLVIVLYLLGASVVALAWWRQRGERFRVLGMVSFLCAMLTLALALGRGRATLGLLGGFQSRYGTLAAPALCWVYFAWELYASPAVGRLAQACLFALACVLLPMNTREGLRHAKAHRLQVEAFEQDLRAGAPTYMLLRRHGPFLFFSLNERLGEGMRMLHRSGIGPFRSMQADPPLREVPLSAVPDALDQMTWEGNTGRGTGNNPSVIFALPEPRFVAGIRITYSYPDTDGSPLYFRAFWKRSDLEDFNERRSYLNAFLERASGERTVTIWVGDIIDKFSIFPDNKSGFFKVSSITIMVPERSPAPHSLGLTGRGP